MDLTLNEVAEITRRHPKTIQRLARTGKLPGAYRVGGRWMFRREALPDLRGEPKPSCGFCGTTARLNTKYRDGKPLCDDCAERVDEGRLPGPVHISEPLKKVAAEIDADRKRKGSRR